MDAHSGTPQPGDMAIVDFKLGGTQTRTMTYGGGGGGTIVAGTGHLSGGWVRTEAIQTNTIPMPDGGIRQLTLNPGEIELLTGSRISAVCIRDREDHWNWIAIKNHETRQILYRTKFEELRLGPRFRKLKTFLLGVALWVLLGVVVTVALLTFGYFFATGYIQADNVFILVPYLVNLLIAAVLSDKLVMGKEAEGALKRRSGKLLKAHDWGGDT